MGTQSLNSWVLIILLLAALIRLTPTLITGQPFSTDVWPLIRLCEILVANPDYRVWNHTVLGGYHNRWPAVLLEGSLYSKLTGLDVSVFFRYVGVAVTAILVVLSIYVLAKKLWGSSAAILSSLTLASVPSLAIFTSATLKEVYSYPLLLALLLLLPYRWGSNWVIPVATLSLALSISHPLTPLIAIASLASYIFINILGSLRRAPGTCLKLLGKSLAVLAILSSTYITYTILYGAGGLLYRPSLGDYLSISLISVAIYGWYAVVGESSARSLPLILLVTGAITALTGNVLMEPWLYAYTIPLVLALLPLLDTRSRSPGDYVAISLLLPISVGALFTATVLPTITHRILNYLSFVATITIGSLSSRRGVSRTYAKLATVVSLATCLAVVFSTAVGSNPVTYYWRYSEEEVTAVEDLVRLSKEGLCGDAKISYLVSYVAEVDTTCGLKLLRGSEIGRPTVLYRDSLRLGYVVSPIDVFRVADPGRVLRSRNLIYSSAMVYVVR